MSLVHELIPLLRCPACAAGRWVLRVDEEHDLPRLEGTLACGACGLAFAARGGVLDLTPEMVEPRVKALRRRLLTRPVAHGMDEILRHLLSPLASPLSVADRTSWLASHGPRHAPKRIIDLGCGRGLDLDVMAGAVSPRIAIGVDRSGVLLAEAAARARAEGRRNVLYVRANLRQLPFAPGTFGWASSNGVLHRLPSPGAALTATAKLLEPGGVLTCTTAHEATGALSRMGQRLVGAATATRFFGREELVTMLYGAGLHPLEVTPYGALALVAARRPKVHSRD